MIEMERITKQFQELYDGNPWIELNIKSTLNTITAEIAATRVMDKCHTIWEIVNHLIAWRHTVKERINGNYLKTPDNNYFDEVNDLSDKAWTETLKKLDHSQNEWLSFLKTFPENDLETINKPGHMTNYELIQGIIQHDAYHLGQIVLLAKQGKKN